MYYTKKTATVAALSIFAAGLCMTSTPAMAASQDGIQSHSFASQSKPKNVANGTGDAEKNLESKGGKIAEKTDRFIVKFKDGTSENNKESTVKKADKETPLDNAKIDRERVDKTTIVDSDKDLNKTDQNKVMSDLKKQPNVEKVEPDFVVENGAAAYPSTPNDPYYPGYQWNMRAVNASGAWNYATGKGVTIGIADTGTTWHPDLNDKWVQGYDFISDTYHSEDGNGRDSSPHDEGDQVENGLNAWHGTHVSGIAAADTNNGQGVSGVAPDAKISMARNMGRGGRGYVSDYADSLMWLAGINIPGVPHNNNPSSVVNFSEAFDSGTCPSVLQNAINQDHARNVPVVVAAGNDGKSANGVSPANCLGAIVVGATAPGNVMTGYSNWGPYLDVVAPGGVTGGDIWSTKNTGQYSLGSPTYGPLNGTSMAAPHVAGIIAEMKERDPNISVESIRALLRNNASQWISGYPMVNARNAVAAVKDTRKPYVKGAIKSYYDSNGGSGKFGNPITNEFQTRNGGATQNFTKGYGIYWAPGIGAHSIMWHGAIGQAFAANGYENGWGYPASDEGHTDSGSAYQFFRNKNGDSILAMWNAKSGVHIIDENDGIGAKWAQSGREHQVGIPVSDEHSLSNGGAWQSFRTLDGKWLPKTYVWSARSGAHEIKEFGAIASVWNHYSRENGKLGFPTSDEYKTGSHVRQNFQGGVVDWDSNTGNTRIL